MHRLSDDRLELFAHHVAAGMTAKAAALGAGFSPTTASAKAHLFTRRPEVQARVAALRGLSPSAPSLMPTPRTRAEKPRRPAQDRSALPPPVAEVAEPNPTAAVPQVPADAADAPVRPPPTPEPQAAHVPVAGHHPAAALRDDIPPPPTGIGAWAPSQMRRWLQENLAALLVEARSANDRRTAISAADSIAKLNALHVQKTEVTVASPLDGLTAPQMITLLRHIEQVTTEAERDASALDGEAEEQEDECLNPLG